MRQSKWHVLVYNLGLLTVFLVLFNNDSAGSPNYNDYNYGNASMKLLRFHDFEPRQQDQRLSEGVVKGVEREARGFHFNPSGEDVSVEFEFIVPFFKVPVKRSMKLARDAMQSILNLRKGALLNTAVIVAAGAIIAAIVRLVLAPLVFTSFGNGFGYKAKEYDATSKSGSKISRGMRSLTEVLETQLDEHNIDVSVCAQRAICLYLQRNAAQLQRHGHSLSSPSPGRLIDVMANSRWVDSFLNGTAVFNAIDVARSNHNCAHVYRSCSWPQLQGDLWQRSWPTVVRYFNGRLFV